MMTDIELQEKLNKNAVFPDKDNSSLCVISYGSRVTIAVDAIIHVSKQYDYVIIYTATNNYKTRHSLKEILDALPAHGFYRIHRAHIVSFVHVKEIQSDCIFIKGHYLPMSVYYKEALYKSLQLFLNEKYDFYSPRE